MLVQTVRRILRENGLVRAPDNHALANRVRDVFVEMLRGFPWTVRFSDWTGQTYEAGGTETHWSGHDALVIDMKDAEVGHSALALDAMRFMEYFVDGQVDLTGNLFLFSEIRNYAKLVLNPLQIVSNRLRNRLLQTPSTAEQSVKSHYDIPEAALELYLDRYGKSYSCAIWQDPSNLSRDEVLAVGDGPGDEADTLERAQWTKFADAADYIRPAADETVLDVGCGYPGFMRVLLERHPCRQVVGWTHSHNQVVHGRRLLEPFDTDTWELHEGDYRLEKRVFDHVHSTGMISHVGPEGKDSGLTNYCREVRRRIKTGGRYLHHSLMTAYTGAPLFRQVGNAFNRQYVWPGFYWYTLADHMVALQENGFQVVECKNLSVHYAKTTFAWYERLLAHRDEFIRHAGEATFRAWQVFLAGITGSFLNKHVHVCRIYCIATEIGRPSLRQSDPTSVPSVSPRSASFVG